MESNKRNCENCRYFSRYYLKKTNYWWGIAKGACENVSVANKVSKKCAVGFVCDLWSEKDNNSNTKEEKLRTNLIDIKHSLKKIFDLLNDRPQ